MKVSVVIPVYNKAPFLREAVDSILLGTFTDLEIIAVDDKSTDDSLEVLRSISDVRMRIIELPQNLGPAGAANAGMDAAKGDYIVRMDADDISVPERISLQVAFMDSHPEVGASGGSVKFFGSEKHAVELPLTPDACAAQLIFGVPVSQGASIFRRSVLEKHALRYDPAWPRIGEDWLFWLRMARHTQFANLRSVVLEYRRGEQNIGHGRDKAVDFVPLQRAAFEQLGIPFTSEELDLHLMGSTIFKITPTLDRVRSLRAWYDHLIALNASSAFAPQKALSERVEEQWDKLFYHLPKYGLFVAIAHLRLNTRWKIAQLAYALKYCAKAYLGPTPKA
ncbi:MAG: glycosyltransferase family 2 protein [Flavobacteriales bacterium]